MSLEKLIPVVNKLQDVFNTVGIMNSIDLPQIAVVGSQSSGKSSVLETIVGRDFLPRGTGIVTRRPLVLQLVNTKESRAADNDTAEWGEFLHVQPHRKFFDFNEIRAEIEKETERITGKNKGVSTLPIRLKIYSPNVLNLTMIDLPGITKVPVGDQPQDIEVQIRNMIMPYVRSPNTIILAVTAANTDLANSDALKLAREVDPQGDRTLGVLTKVDLMDNGTDAMDVLSGRVINLKLGFIGVVNRSQSDIQANKPIRDALEAEANYFRKHPSYRNIAQKMGTPFLAKSLNLLLLNHIRRCLPELKQQISSFMTQTLQVVEQYGDPITDSRMSQGAMVLQLVTRFSTEFVESIDGHTPDLITTELFGGARINQIFNEKFAPYLFKLDAIEGLTDKDIRMAIRNAKGPRSSLFVPESSFEMLVKRQVKKLEEPCMRCIDQVYEELLRIVEHSEKHLARFPNLREKVREFVVGLLRSFLLPLKEFASDLIQIELAYVNTNHPDFFSGGQTVGLLVERMQQASTNPEPVTPQPQQQPQQQQQLPVTMPAGAARLGQQPQQQQQQQLQQQQQQQQAVAPVRRTQTQAEYISSKEKMESDIIRGLLTEYFAIVRKNISDSVPKSTMHFLVNRSKQCLQSELVRALYKDDLFDSLLEENKELAAKRKQAHEMVRILQRAVDIINEVRDFAVQ